MDEKFLKASGEFIFSDMFKIAFSFCIFIISLELGFEIVANTPEQFSAYQAAEFSRWAKLIQSRNIKAD